MLTDTEFTEIVTAITKPVDTDQIMRYGRIKAEQLNMAEAYRATKALLKYYEDKRKEANEHRFS